MSKDYNTYTYNDPNPIKRQLHRGRFNYALKLIAAKKEANILDYGCGDGHFLKIMHDNYPQNNYYGYEPYPGMYQQAQRKLKDTPVKIYLDLNRLKEKKYNKIFCLETAEHLDEKDMVEIFKNVINWLEKDGQAIFSVPVETGLSALLKNGYRFFKNKKYQGLDLKTYFCSIFGLKIKRKKIEIAPGLNYCFSHIGFNHKNFESILKKYFVLKKKKYHPFSFSRGFLNNTVYYIAQKKE